jgi:hypothetical protein
MEVRSPGWSDTAAMDQGSPDLKPTAGLSEPRCARTWVGGEELMFVTSRAPRPEDLGWYFALAS